MNELVELAFTCDIKLELDLDNKIIAFYDNKNEIFKIQFFDVNNVFCLLNPTLDPKVDHLINILKNKNFVTINDTYDILAFIKSDLDNLKNHCVGCNDLLEYTPDDYIHCGKDECMYKYEENQFGNPVLNKYRDDIDMFLFLFESMVCGIKSQRKMSIFDPFPTNFLNDKNVNMKRGEVSALNKNNFDSSKNFKKLDSIVSELNEKKLMEVFDISNSDSDLVKYLSKDTYLLLRFMVLSCKLEIIRNKTFHEKYDIGSIKIYDINHPSYINNTFNETKNNQKTQFLFHGSKWENWFSIMRNGLKNCSGTTLMTAGAAHGNGIYLSNNINLSYGYGSSVTKNMSVVGVFEIIGEQDKYKKTTDIFVCPDENALLQKYIIIMKNNTNIMILNQIFNKDIYVENSKIQSFVMTKGLKKLIREYKTIIKSNPDELGFRIDVNSNDLYLWKVFIYKYDEKYGIGQDMKKYGIKEIELEMKFGTDYPYAPPFVRVIRPRFKRLTGHITSGGALCMEILTKSGWSPACSIEALLVSIKSEILEGEARLDPHNAVAYNIGDAQQSFVVLCKTHGWM